MCFDLNQIFKRFGFSLTLFNSRQSFGTPGGLLFVATCNVYPASVSSLCDVTVIVLSWYCGRLMGLAYLLKPQY